MPNLDELKEAVNYLSACSNMTTLMDGYVNTLIKLA